MGSLYIAPLTSPETQQQQQQQQQQKTSTSPRSDSGLATTSTPQLRWMSAKPTVKEQPEWARPEEEGNVMPSSIQRMKATQQQQLPIQQSKAPIAQQQMNMQRPQMPMQHQQQQEINVQQQQLPRHEQLNTHYISTSNNSNNPTVTANTINFGAHGQPSATGLRLHITIPTSQFVTGGSKVNRTIKFLIFTI